MHNISVGVVSLQKMFPMQYKLIPDNLVSFFVWIKYACANIHKENQWLKRYCLLIFAVL